MVRTRVVHFTILANEGQTYEQNEWVVTLRSEIFLGLFTVTYANYFYITGAQLKARKISASVLRTSNWLPRPVDLLQIIYCRQILYIRHTEALFFSSFCRSITTSLTFETLLYPRKSWFICGIAGKLGVPLFLVRYGRFFFLLWAWPAMTEVWVYNALHRILKKLSLDRMGRALHLEILRRCFFFFCQRSCKRTISRPLEGSFYYFVS